MSDWREMRRLEHEIERQAWELNRENETFIYCLTMINAYVDNMLFDLNKALNAHYMTVLIIRIILLAGSIALFLLSIGLYEVFYG